MGKKTRRSNGNKQKDTANAAVAAAALDDQERNQMNSFNQLFESKDWEGVLQLESTVTRVANEIENTHPSNAGICYHYLGTAHKELRREGGVDQAIVHFQKAIEMAKKASNECLHHGAVRNLAECYIMMGRIQEAMDLHKSLVADIGKERLMPNYILGVTASLINHKEFGRALEVLQNNLTIWTALQAPGTNQNKAKHTA